METIGINILNLRKQLQLTQEELAVKIKVSAGAVSKWECGHSYPDITLLIPLAHALHTTIDELMSFHQELEKEKTHRYKQAFAKQFSSIGYDACEQQIDELLSKYPNDMYLKLSMASLLYMNLMYADEQQLKYKKIKIKHMIETVMTSSRHDLYAQSSYMYVILLMEEGNYEEAHCILEKMSASNIDISALYMNLYQHENKQKELHAVSQRILLDGFVKMKSALSVLAKTDEEHRYMFLQNIDELEKTYQCTYRQAQRLLTTYYLQQHQDRKAAHAYLTYIQSLLTFPYHHVENPYLSSIVLEYKEEAQQEMRKKLLESELYDTELESLKECEDYKKAVKLMQDYLNVKDCDS